MIELAGFLWWRRDRLSHRDPRQHGDRLDMVARATELGVARATLYSSTGDRDRLLAERDKRGGS